MSNLFDIQYRPPPQKKIKLVKFLIESCREKLFIFETFRSIFKSIFGERNSPPHSPLQLNDRSLKRITTEGGQQE